MSGQENDLRRAWPVWRAVTVGGGSKGELGGKGSRSLLLFGVTIYRFKNGKVSGHSQVFDRTAVMRQLGYIK